MSDEGVRRLKMGVVGGGRDAFIGSVHRMAARLDGGIEIIGGALSSTPERSLSSGGDLGFAPDRTYPTWAAMLDAERARPAAERIDVVSIVTPNESHFEIAKAFIDAGFHVIVDKPMVCTVDEARALERAVAAAGVVCCVTYNYSGYPMVKQARHLVASGAIGTVRKVIVEYNQGWLASKLEATGQKQADWRTDPARAGVGGAIGDIGSHAEHLVSYVTGLEIEALCADLTSFVPGRRLDDDANLLLRFTNGARGILTASQICVGNRNDLRLRVWGTEGGLAWRQETPESLVVRSPSGAETTHFRGEDGLSPEAAGASRLPFGHPEAFIEAFANVYRQAAAAIRAGDASRGRFDYPDVHDGARGVRFIHTTVASSGSETKWTPMIDA